MLAAASLGAIWSSCSPDFGVQGVLDRFGQIEPKLLITADGYWYDGKSFDSLARIGECLPQLPSVEQVIVLPYLSERAGSGEAAEGRAAGATSSRPTPAGDDRLRAAALQPSALHHVFLGHHRRAEMHRARRRRHAAPASEGASAALRHQAAATGVFYFTTCGWMMWNWLVSGLASGATLLLYDGSPFHPDGNVLFDFAAGRALHLLRHLGQISSTPAPRPG